MKQLRFILSDKLLQKNVIKHHHPHLTPSVSDITVNEWNFHIVLKRHAISGMIVTLSLDFT